MSEFYGTKKIIAASLAACLGTGALTAGCSSSKERPKPLPSVVQSAEAPVPSSTARRWLEICGPWSPDAWTAVPTEILNQDELITAAADSVKVFKERIVAGKWGRATCLHEIDRTNIMLLIDPAVPDVSQICAPIGWPDKQGHPLDVFAICPAFD